MDYRQARWLSDVRVICRESLNWVMARHGEMMVLKIQAVAIKFNLLEIA